MYQCTLQDGVHLQLLEPIISVDFKVAREWKRKAGVPDKVVFVILRVFVIV